MQKPGQEPPEGADWRLKNDLHLNASSAAAVAWSSSKGLFLLLLWAPAVKTRVIFLQKKVVRPFILLSV